MYRLDIVTGYIAIAYREEGVLELALLGLLREAPVHGYELRKQLVLRLGGLRAYSYGSLYPALRRLTRAGLIVEESGSPAKRARKVYRITAEGKERFDEMLAEAGPNAWDDEGFGVHLAFFASTPTETRMRILEGRRRCVEERREGMRSALAKAGEQIDRYTRQLQQLGLDACEREVRWLNELIENEKKENGP
jgi:DNA-binding PadR family transcriptional regulator